MSRWLALVRRGSSPLVLDVALATVLAVASLPGAFHERPANLTIERFPARTSGQPAKPAKGFKVFYDDRVVGTHKTLKAAQAQLEQLRKTKPNIKRPLGIVIPLTLLATLPVAFRRRYPLAVLAVTLPAALTMQVVYSSFQFAGALVAVYTLGAHVGRPTSMRVGLGAAPALALVSAGHHGLGLWESAAIFAVFSAAWLLGDNLRTRRAYLSELEERAARLEREREENVRRAAADEQARIARELHDIITHNVSVMTVQAAAAGDVFETHPGRAREALGSIESTGREALTELRRLLGNVRGTEGQGSFAPQPGLAELDALIEQVRSAGLATELTVEGQPREVPAGVDLSAYRIVQEALTNTLKHAQASRATVLVRYGSGILDIGVVDDGKGPSGDGSEVGHGIIGMRERAALVGGELWVGAAPSGGFAVHARIPLEESES